MHCGFRDLTLMLLLFDSGLCMSEAIGLTFEDLSLDERIISVPGKGNKEKQVPAGHHVLHYINTKGG